MVMSMHILHIMMRLTKNFEAGGILLRVLSRRCQLVARTALQALAMVRLHNHHYCDETDTLKVELQLG